MWSLLASLVPAALKGVWDLGGQWLENRRKISEAKGELEAKKTELTGRIELTRLESGIEKMKQDGAWESIQATNSGNSWKDELWTVILALPLVLVTISPLVDMWMDPEPYSQGALITATQTSLKALDSFPDWYVVLLFVAVGAAFGVRIWDRFRTQNGRLTFVGSDSGGRTSEPAPVRGAVEQKIDK